MAVVRATNETLAPEAAQNMDLELPDAPDSDAGPAQTTLATVATATISPVTSSAHLPPKVQSVIPAMFVPLDFDITQPFEAPRDRVSSVKARLQSIEFHRKGVRRGLLHLANMDHQRILAELELAEAGAEAGAEIDAQMNSAMAADGAEAEREAGAGEDLDTNLGADLGATKTRYGGGGERFVDEAEIDELIGMMQQPATDGKDYSVNSADLAQNMPQFFAPVDLPGDRRDVVRQLQRLVEQAVSQMNGYDRYAKRLAEHWNGVLEKEERTIQERFGVQSATSNTGVDISKGNAAGKQQATSVATSSAAGPTALAP